MTGVFRLPTAECVLEDSGDVLRVFSGRAHATFEFRVDYGLVFFRELPANSHPTPPHGQTPAGGMPTVPARRWQQASLDSVLELFVSNSPVAAWLRTRGADVLRASLLGIGAPEATGSGDA